MVVFHISNGEWINIEELCRNSGKSIQHWNAQDELKGKYNVCYAKSNILFFI
jgi:hypothetical protein